MSVAAAAVAAGPSQYLTLAFITVDRELTLGVGLSGQVFEDWVAI